MKRSPLSAVAIAVVFATGCGVAQQRPEAPPEQVAESQGLSWEAFLQRVYVEPETGVIIADGDTPLYGEKQLREFYERNFAKGQLIINRVGSADDRWTDVQKQNLTYCVSDTFGARKGQVVQAMASATGAWEDVADVHYVYVSTEDGTCNASNNNILFDVRPVNAGGSYLARAFFPSTPRATRNVLIDNSAFTSTDVSFIGVLRHELGHTLGFRHEHTRPEAGTCFEDNSWRVLTPYDSASVMHYPQCNGTGSFTGLELTELDAEGAAAVYGAPGGTNPPPPPPPPPPATTTETFNGSVARLETDAFGPFNVTAGTTFKATLSGSGDGDLYVRFGAAPTASAYNCRPYLSSTAEECTLTVPANVTTAYVNVVGYRAATYTLKVEYVKAGGGSMGTPKTDSDSGSVTQGQQVPYQALRVLAGTTFKVQMTGTGDPDLYVRFGSAPTLTAYDCRPYVDGATETCELTVPPGATQAFMMVNGYSAGTYTLNVSWTEP